MSVIRGTATVFRFEWKRSLTFTRGIWWILLAAFPPALMLLIVLTTGQRPPVELAAPVVYILCPGVVSMLGVFLWATPWLSSELEGRSWVYPAVRPRGAWSVLFGKYLNAVTWTIPAGLIAAVLAILIVSPGDWLRLTWIAWRLVALSCLSYAALFALIGTIFPKRAMVFSIFYTLVVEVVLTNIPAAINLLTVQYRLRCLAVRWMDLDLSWAASNPFFMPYFGDESATWHLGVLLAMTLGFLTTAAFLVSYRQFTSAAEFDV